MKITSRVTEVNGMRCSQWKAVINKSKKLGIKRRHQKTWSLRNVAPTSTLSEMVQSVEAEAKRWEAKILKSYQVPLTIQEMSEKNLL